MDKSDTEFCIQVSVDTVDSKGENQVPRVCLVSLVIGKGHSRCWLGRGFLPNSATTHHHWFSENMTSTRGGHCRHLDQSEPGSGWGSIQRGSSGQAWGVPGRAKVILFQWKTWHPSHAMTFECPSLGSIMTWELVYQCGIIVISLLNFAVAVFTLHHGWRLESKTKLTSIGTANLHHQLFGLAQKWGTLKTKLSTLSSPASAH